MSRIGRRPIHLPSGVRLAESGGTVQVEGPRGKRDHRLPPGIRVETEGDIVRVLRDDDERDTRALHGLTRKLLHNIVVGLSDGFRETLEIVGVGYRAEVRDSSIVFNLGFSRPKEFPLPDGVSAKVDRQTVVTLEASDRQLLGQVAAQIRSLRPPEPYKGKGIRYAEERIRRKAGKAAAGGK